MAFTEENALQLLNATVSTLAERLARTEDSVAFFQRKAFYANTDRDQARADKELTVAQQELRRFNGYLGTMPPTVRDAIYQDAQGRREIEDMEP